MNLQRTWLLVKGIRYIWRGIWLFMCATGAVECQTYVLRVIHNVQSSGVRSGFQSVGPMEGSQIEVQGLVLHLSLDMQPLTSA